MNKKKVIIISIILVITLATTLIFTRPNFRKLLGSVNLMNLQAIDVPYTNNSQSTVKGAIDDLYSKANNMECGVGYEKGETTANGGYECIVPPPICKRATSLHTEICEQSDSSYYCSASGDIGNGNQITYGILGSGNTLQVGEALDCKVTTTGDYTERFYYITDLESNSNYAVLIYYKDASNGGVAYSSSDNNYYGPVTAVQSLPTTSSWNNISLYQTTRQLYAWDHSNLDVYNTTTTNNGSNTLGIFDYSAYAARLLTVKELREACPNASNTVASLSNCNYILENTKYSKSSNKTYGPWLETPHASISNSVLRVDSDNRNLNINRVIYSDLGGARPVIEVPKSRIQLN